MEKVIYRISLDVGRNGIQKTIQGIETGDVYAREIRITLRNGKENYELPTDNSVVAYMKVVKPSTSEGDPNACTIENGEIVYSVNATDFTEVGTTILQLELVESSPTGMTKRLIAPRFAVEVWESEIVAPSTTSQSSYTQLTSSLAQARAYYNKRFKEITVDDDNVVHVIFYNGTSTTDYTSDSLNAITGKIVDLEEDVDDLTTAMSGKADKSYVDTKVAAKADKTYVDTELDKKTSKTYVDNKLSLKVNSYNPSTGGSFSHNGNVYADDYYYYEEDDALDGGGDAFRTQISVRDAISGLNTSLSNKANKNNPSTSGTFTHTGDATVSGSVAAASLSYKDGSNTVDVKSAINTIASKPSGITLTSASPLQSSTASSIVGIDVDGCSTQYVSKNICSRRITETKNGLTYTLADGKLTISGTASAQTDIDLIASAVSLTSGQTVYWKMYNAFPNGLSLRMTSVADTTTSTSGSKAITSSGTSYMLLRVANGVTLNGTYYINIAINSACADTYEPYTGTPTPTNPIAIVDASGEVVAHTVNLFNDVLEVGSIGSTGNNISDSAKVRQKDYTEVKPNTDYTVSYKVETNVNIVTHFYDENKTFISRVFTRTFTTPSNCAYIRLRSEALTTVDTSNLFMLEQGTTATSYVEYASNKITLPTLRSVGDVKDELIVNSDGSGQIVRRVGVKTITTVDEVINENQDTAYSKNAISDGNLPNYTTNYICSHASSNSISASDTREGSYVFGNSIRFRKSDLKTKTAWDAWLATNTITVYYPLATPTTTTLTASEVSAIRALQTYSGTTIVDSALDVKSVTYHADTKQYIDGRTDYSYSDTVIGKWADGKPLHRMVIEATTPSQTDYSTLVSSVINGSHYSVKKIDGMLNYNSSISVPVNAYAKSDYIITFINTDGVYMKCSSGYASKPCEIIVEYTLNDDAEQISVLSEGGDE